MLESCVYLSRVVTILVRECTIEVLTHTAPRARGTLEMRRVPVSTPVCVGSRGERGAGLGSKGI